MIERIDADGISTQKLEYNLDDAQIKSIDALNQVTTFKYDSNGRKVETINAEGNSERIDYDVLGNVIGKSDGLGNKTRYDYDALNHLKAVVNALGESTTYTRDNNGNVLSQIDGNGHTTMYRYNARNLLYMSMEPMDPIDEHNVTGYMYDYNGNLIVTVKANENIILSDYDILNRLTHKKSGKINDEYKKMEAEIPIDVIESIDYSYDPNGNLLTLQDATGLSTWTYDETGRALTKTVTGIGLSTYAYDLTAGIDSLMPGYRAEKTTDPLGGITLKVYDKVDRLVQVTDAGETTQFEYYPNGNRKSVTYPDGSKEVYTYNKIGQNTSLISLKADGTVIDTYSYTYDAAGNQTSKTDAKGTTTFTYDKLNRLAEVTEPSGIKTTYSFDKAGNRISEKKYAGASLLQDTSYSYDLANRLIQTQTKKNATSETEKTVYSYDLSGNMVSQSKTTIKPAVIDVQATFVLEKGKASADLVTLYAYDGFNQLKQSDDGINQITYVYNGFGLRTQKSVKAKDNPITTVTKYLYEGDKIILELDGSGNKIAKNTFGTNLLSREMAETKVYYMYNGHGDVTTLLNETGAIVGTYYYDAWGNILEKNESEQITNPYRYAGYQYDDETGLYYLNARYYDAKIARFLTEDTVTGDRKDPLSLNRYSYCYNNPLVYTDPTGNIANMMLVDDGAGSGSSKSNKNKSQKTAMGNLTDVAKDGMVSWNEKTKTATLSYVDAKGKVVSTSYDLGTLDKNKQGKASDGSTFTIKNGKIQVAITETTNKLTGSKPFVPNPILPPEALKATNQPVSKTSENTEQDKVKPQSFGQDILSKSTVLIAGAGKAGKAAFNKDNGLEFLAGVGTIFVVITALNSSVFDEFLLSETVDAPKNKIEEDTSEGTDKDSYLTPQQLNQYKKKVAAGEDLHFDSKEQAEEFIEKKFPDFKQEEAGSRSAEGWHFDSHSIGGSENAIDHINIYSKGQGFRVHITWGD